MSVSHRRSSFLFLIVFTILSAISSISAQEVIGELVGDGIARFYPSTMNLNSQPRSVAYLTEPKKTGALPSTWQEKPTFTSANGKKVFVFPVAPGTSLYGTGENAGPLLRNGTTKTMWNTDAWGYNDQTPSLYQALTWVLAVRSDGTAYGIHANTTWRCEINLQNQIQFSADGNDYYCLVIQGATPQDVIKKCAVLTGTLSLPPLWALGYQQSRNAYESDTRVRTIADGFRSRNIPCDVIWVDIPYMDGFKVFTFNNTTFPDPKATNDYLHSKNFKGIWMINPGVEARAGYFVYDQGTQRNVWVKTSDGTTDFQGKVWPPLPCVFPDYTMPATHTLFSTFYPAFMAKGIDGVWNDMNEPALFNVASKTMPETNIHRGGDGLPIGTHAQYHNIFGMLMVKSTRESILAANPLKRPFVLSRANYFGGHRYAATWTGDNIASWPHLRWSVSMLLNVGLSMQPFIGADIGGYVGSGDAVLFRRWMGLGAFYPFCRAHTERAARDKEPWTWDDATTNASRVSLQRRYRLLPFYYTLFHEASTNGMPVMRPVFFADPKDTALRSEDRAFLLGQDLLIVPNLYLDNPLPIKEPAGAWRTVYLIDKASEDNVDQPMIKIREGSIVPAGRLIQSTVENMLDTLTLVINPDKEFKAIGTLYEDAGEGFGYQSGDYLLTRYVVRPWKKDTVLVSIDSTAGNKVRPDRPVVVLTVTQNTTTKTSGREKNGIPVYMPGAPATVGTTRPISHSGAFIGCVNNVLKVTNVQNAVGTIIIYSVSGKVLIAKSIALKGNSFSMPLAALPLGEGMYVVRVKLDSGEGLIAPFFKRR